MSPRVVIIGAGYAGVGAAKRLARSSARVTLINPRADFVERIRLHQFVAGNHPASVPLTSLLPSSTGFVRDSASTIDPGERTVTLDGGESVDFDYLIYAAGSRSQPDVLPGAARHGVTVGSMADAEAARERLAQLPTASTVTVVGGGLTGIELAAELAELGTHRIRLVTDGALAPGVSAKGRGYLRDRLTSLGAAVLEDTAVREVDEGKLTLANGDTLDSDLSVLTTRFTAPALAADSGLPVAADNALLVNPSLVSTTADTIVGAGDACRIDAAPVRMSCQAAVPLGTHAAETVLSLAAGETPKPVRPRFSGQCISLGRRSGMVQATTFADQPRSAILTGRTAAKLKEQVCAGTTRIMLNPRLPRVALSWS